MVWRYEDENPISSIFVDPFQSTRPRTMSSAHQVEYWETGWEWSNLFSAPVTETVYDNKCEKVYETVYEVFKWEINL